MSNVTAWTWGIRPIVGIAVYFIVVLVVYFSCYWEFFLYIHLFSILAVIQPLAAML